MDGVCFQLLFGREYCHGFTDAIAVEHIGQVDVSATNSLEAVSLSIQKHKWPPRSYLAQVFKSFW